MLLGQMFGLIEDVRFTINLEAGIGQPESAGNLADPDNRHRGFIGSQGLLPKSRKSK